jgi:prevent-host-death family protein
MEISISDIRDQLADAINRVAYGDERIILTRRGKGVVALVSMEELRFLERCEDQYDVTEARKALAEGGKPIPLEEVKKRLGLSSPKPRRSRAKAGKG